MAFSIVSGVIETHFERFWINFATPQVDPSGNAATREGKSLRRRLWVVLSPGVACGGQWSHQSTREVSRNSVVFMPRGLDRFLRNGGINHLRCEE